MFVKERMGVKYITAAKRKKKLTDKYQTTDFRTQYNAIHEDQKEIFLKDFMKEEVERMNAKKIWNDTTQCN